MSKGENGFPEMKKLIEFRLDEHDKKLDNVTNELEGVKKQLTILNSKYTILQTKIGLYVSVLSIGVGAFGHLVFYLVKSYLQNPI
jgi:hypothetical protein